MPNARLRRTKKFKDKTKAGGGTHVKKSDQCKGKSGLGRKRAQKRNRIARDRFEPKPEELETPPEKISLVELHKLNEQRAKEKAEGNEEDAEELESDSEPAQKGRKKKRRKLEAEDADDDDADDDDDEDTRPQKGSVEFGDNGSTRRKAGEKRAASKPLRLEYGCKVCLTGLKGSPELNGQVGTCLSYEEDKDRWYVRLGDNSNKLLKATNLKVLVLKEGATVCLQGLKGAAELNGQLGVCRRFDTSKQRWLVRLKGGVEKLLKAENLEVDSSKAMGKYSISPMVKQSVQVCKESAKPNELVQFIKRLREEEKRGVRISSLTMVFCSSPEKVRAVARCLGDAQLHCTPLHCELSDLKREHALDDFSLDGKRILVLTEDAISEAPSSQVAQLVNYDFPITLEEYCKRTTTFLGSDADLEMARSRVTVHSLLTRTSASLAKDFAALLEHTEGRAPPELTKLISRASGEAVNTS